MGRKIMTDSELYNICHERFEYKNGELFWRYKVAQCVEVGGLAGYFHKGSGYMHVAIYRKCYKVHRIIYLMHHGYLPELLDHIDQNRSNNVISNLRPATSAQNAVNSKVKCTNTTSFPGVIWNKKNKNWRARVGFEGKRIDVGSFSDKNEAFLAYQTKHIELFGEFSPYFNKKEN